jgi:hypothetical protein
MSLSKQVKTALDETRLLMLGAQVLFGFKLNGVFQEEFANLSLASRYVDCAGQVLMAMAIGLLVAPSMQHRIVENGEDTVRIHRVTGVFAGMALLPFAVSLGLGFYIVFDHVFGATAAFVAGSAFCLLAGMFWYGLGFSLRRKNRKRAMQEEKPTPLTTKIEQMLTEARVILPGAQALLGFQLTVTLTRAFGQLSDSLKLFHVASLCCVAVWPSSCSWHPPRFIAFRLRDRIHHHSSRSDPGSSSLRARHWRSALQAISMSQPQRRRHR